MMERIDKIIASAANMSRKEVCDAVRKGRVCANGKKVLSVKDKYDAENSVFTLDGKEIKYAEFVYIMMNKPKGVISASSSEKDRTVIDILPQEMKRKKLFPAGRLDRDTTGFLLITDDGEFAHKILSPKNHIPKQYSAVLDKPFDDAVIEEFKNGVELKDGVCMPALLAPCGDDYTKCLVTIKQGMYHQIKRMFAKFGITVLQLKRIKMGATELDPDLKEGESRYMTDKEVKNTAAEK